MREFEERFITLAQLPRHRRSALLRAPEIRDALAYLRLRRQPDDDLALDRIINVPKRGLGDAATQIVNQTSRAVEKPKLATIRDLIDTEDLKPRQRSTFRDLVRQIDDWADRLRTIPHFELAEQILDESGYTAMWQNDKSADAPGRLENLKELIRSMEEFENLGGFLEHIALVMDRDTGDASDAVSIMTLHSAKGLEFNTVFLPGWEEGLFPHQRSLDETGLAGLEEERRLAYVGITRARKRCHISLAQNRRIHGLWQSAIPSRFLDELPAEAVEVKDTGSSYGGYTYGGRAATRFDARDPFESVYETPGWQRAQRQQQSRKSPGPLTIEGDLVARSSGPSAAYGIGERVFHLNFGYGTVTAAEGNKLSIDFEKAGPKKVLDSFVKRG